MDGFAGTRAEREWLAVLRRIADALERLADAAEQDERCLSCGGEREAVPGTGGSFCPRCDPKPYGVPEKEAE